MFWRPVFLLTSLRWRAAWRTYTRSSSAVTGAVIALFVFGPAAVAAAHLCGKTLSALPADRLPAALSAILLAVQAIWLLLLLLPGSNGGSLAALSPSLPPSVLRPFPLRPFPTVFAGAVGAFLDLPLLFALPVLGTIAARSGHGALPIALIGVTLALLAFLTAALAQALEQAGALLSRQRRSSVAWSVLVAALALGVYFGLPSVVSAATVSPPEALLAAMKSHGPPTPLVDSLLPAWTWVLPSGIAARGIAAAGAGDCLPAAGDMLILTAVIALTLWGAARLQRAATAREAAGSGRRAPRRAPAAREMAAQRSAPSAGEQVRAVAETEWKVLTRHPARHLPLRSPASLLMTMFIGWLAPNLGPDALGNMWDLLGMGGLLYVALWQMQLLTDRFGSEAGTAGLLFSFPISRARLLLGRNLALGALLLLIDGTLTVGICLNAHATQWIAPILLWLPAILIVLTAIGNFVSALSPFPIPRRGERFGSEPDRSLTFLYVLLGFATWALLAPITWALTAAHSLGPVAVAAAGLLGAGYLLGLYALTLPFAGRLLARRERRLIRALDRDL